MAARNPARVLPEPVGAQTSVCWPATIAGQPPAWASVGPSGNRRSNHTRIAGWNRSRIPGTPETAGAAGSELMDISASHYPLVPHTNACTVGGCQGVAAGRSARSRRDWLVAEGARKGRALERVSHPGPALASGSPSSEKSIIDREASSGTGEAFKMSRFGENL